MNYTEEEITKAFDLLPRSIQNVVFSPGLQTKVDKMGAEAGLNIDQLIILNNLVNFAIMKLLSQGDLLPTIEETFSLKGSPLKSLGDNLSREVFASIEAMEKEAEKAKDIFKVSDEVEKEGENPLPPSNVKVSVDESSPIKAPVVNPSTEKLAPTSQMWQKISGASPGFFEGKASSPEAVDTNKEIPEFINEWSKESVGVPKNLPTEEEREHLLPPIPEKIRPAILETPSHSFEEKMRQAFTEGKQSLDTLAIESTPPEPKAVVPSSTSTSSSSDPYREPIE